MSNIDKKYPLNYYEGAHYWKEKERWIYDTKTKTHMLTWNEILDLFCEFNIYDDKNKVPLVLFGQWIDEPVYKEWNGEKYIKKISDNVKSVDLLLLDYDKGISIEEFKQRYSHLEYYLYTSYNHTVKEPEFDRYRVLVPITQPIPVELLNKTYDVEIVTSLGKYFDSVSPETWDIGRGFFVPGCNKENYKNMVVHYNEGEILDWTTLELVEVLKAPERIKIVRPTEKNGKYGRIVLSSLDIVSFFKDQGLYDKQNSSSGSKTIHQVICPGASSHTGGDTTGTVIIEGGDGWGFRCQHGHGMGAGFKVGNKWLIDYYGIEAFRPYCDVEQHKHEQELSEVDNLIEKYKQMTKGIENDN